MYFGHVISECRVFEILNTLSHFDSIFLNLELMFAL